MGLAGCSVTVSPATFPEDTGSGHRPPAALCPDCGLVRYGGGRRPLRTVTREDARSRDVVGVHVHLHGVLLAAPEMGVTCKGHTSARATIAAHVPVQGCGETSWHLEAEAFGERGEDLGSCRAGDAVAVSGSLFLRTSFGDVLWHLRIDGITSDDGGPWEVPSSHPALGPEAA